MKKKVTLFVLLIIAIVTVLGLFFAFNSNQKFYLEDKYYGQAKFEEIDATELDQLIENRESFALFIYQPACVTSANFEDVLTEAITERPITVYKIAFSNLKDTKLKDKISYYPSFAIFRKGKLVDFLKSDQDEDTAKFENKEDFLKWFTGYVLIKNGSSRPIEINNDNSSEDSASSVDLSHITKTDGKVNIYFFWGNGCPHCAAEKEFFQEIEREYGKYYNMYLFETWYNDGNAALMKKFAAAMGDEIKGVPYTIIGDKSFIGFSEQHKEEMKAAIKKYATGDADIYFNKVKPELDREKENS